MDGQPFRAIPETRNSRLIPWNRRHFLRERPRSRIRSQLTAGLPPERVRIRVGGIMRIRVDDSCSRNGFWAHSTIPSQGFPGSREVAARYVLLPNDEVGIPPGKVRCSLAVDHRSCPLQARHTLVEAGQARRSRLRQIPKEISTLPARATRLTFLPPRTVLNRNRSAVVLNDVTPALPARPAGRASPVRLRICSLQRVAKNQASLNQ
jgi:hypothetical protein